MATGLPAGLRGDASRLRQILLNLVGNAIKFTHQGHILLRVEVEPGDQLSFRVKDTGIGISPEDQKRLFLPFNQADSSAARHFGGTGLGLAISRHLVEMMGGTIGVESAVGRGSTFWVELARAGHLAGDEAGQVLGVAARGGAHHLGHRVAGAEGQHAEAGRAGPAALGGLQDAVPP